MRTGNTESATIADISAATVLNSHLEWTPEYTIRLADGRIGRGSTPRGETPSTYEVRHGDSELNGDVADELRQALLGRAMNQYSLDRMIRDHRSRWGHQTGFALSVGFFEAIRSGAANVREHTMSVLFNLVNGGLHAYTNPVSIDFAEILLVPKDTGLVPSIHAYQALLQAIRSMLAGIPQCKAGDNLVHDLGPDSNDAALRLICDLLDLSGYADTFTLMIDASAGDWFDGWSYVLPVSGATYLPHEMVDYWLDLLDRYPITMLEDPLAETDLTAWQALRRARPDRCRLLGDNLTSTLPAELAVKSGLVDGVLVKPDQNGTVSGARRFVDLADEADLCTVASHRSIETDIPFLVHFAAAANTQYIKIGPFSDFSAVLRTNELLRITSR